MLLCSKRNDISNFVERFFNVFPSMNRRDEFLVLRKQHQVQVSVVESAAICCLAYGHMETCANCLVEC